ncbi:MAG: class I SAM-dependent methyltransferase [Patescibacteria group bacterium]|nr:class I SAM-dependent methyltransferase [Patescibacteria group bacterium]
MKTKNKIKDLLIELGICSSETIAPYFPKVRDRDDVAVLKCGKSGVIFLSRSDHMDISHYSEKPGFSYQGAPDRKTALVSKMEDTQRRYDQFKMLISNKKWLDIGTGVGGILDLLSPVALETEAVEPQDVARKCLSDLGYKVYSSIEDARDDNYEVITLFHVLEHFTDPIDTLITIRKKMVKGAKIIIEIPHARDFLISFFEHEAFKSFTFWSEHLILHTRESIAKFLAKAGFSNIIVNGYQRYPLANHLYWLSKNKPGGHISWPYLRTAALDREYANMLAAIDKTDTLIVTAEKL